MRKPVKEEQVVKNIQTKVWRRDKKIKVRVEFEVDECSYWDKETVEERAEVNQWILEYYLTFMNFDYYSTIQLLCDSLEVLGKGLLKWNNHSDALRTGRRALFAAHLLHKAYDNAYYELSDTDKSYINWKSRHTDYFEPVRRNQMLGQAWCHKYLYDNAMGMDREEYSTKMYRLILKRNKKVFEERKIAAWNFLNKHIESFWD